MILSAFSNAVLSAAASFFIFCYPLSKIISRPATIAIGFLSAVLVAVAVYFFTAKKENSRRVAKNGKSAFNERMHALYVCTDDEIQSLFSSIFFNLQICAQVDGRHMRLDGGEIVYAALLPEPMSANELVTIYRGLDIKEKPVSIISSSFLPDAAKIAEKLNITLVGAEEFYSFLKKSAPAPEPKTTAPKKSFGYLFIPKFDHESGRRFLIFSAVTGLFSVFSFFPVYYVLISAIFAIYGLIALFFGKSLSDTRGGEALEKLFEKSSKKNAAI